CVRGRADGGGEGDRDGRRDRPKSGTDERGREPPERLHGACRRPLPRADGGARPGDRRPGPTPPTSAGGHRPPLSPAETPQLLGPAVSPNPPTAEAASSSSYRNHSIGRPE